MSKKKILAILTGTATVATAIAAYEAKKKADKTTYEANLIEPIKKRKRGIYEKYIKRALDVICATGAIVVFSPVYLGVAVLVKLKLGSPVLFTQDRPGLIGKDGRETVFKMYKFRTMTDERDENGELLPDEARLTKFGKWLRNTSLDELPEAFNILNGTMSVIGPRPQLVRDMVFMTDEQRLRHTAKPGLSGLAQVNGRNAISWEDKLEWDLKYIRNISLAEDIKIILAKDPSKIFITGNTVIDGCTICPGGYGANSGESGTGFGISLQIDGDKQERTCYCNQPVWRDSRHAGSTSSCKGKGNDNTGNRECGRKQYCT